MRTKTLKPYLAVLFTLVLSVAGVQAQFNFDHIGTGATGSITPNADAGSYTLIGGGDDIWSGSDNFDFAHSTINGDFDIRVRVESLEPVAKWTKAGIMARETPLAPNNRMAFNRVTPPDVPTGNGGNGANDSRFAYRTGTSTPALGEHEDGTGAPQYPNGYLRLVRAGSVFTAYASADGLNWRQQGRQDTAGWEGGAIQPALEVGLGVSRHSSTVGELLATCEFRDYANAASTPAAITTQPANTQAEEGFAATFSFRAPGGFDIYDIQWRKNGVDIAGANAPTYTTAPLAGTDSGTAYSVAIRQRNNSTTATSADGIVTVVPDTTKPGVASIGVTAGIANRVVVVFTEPVNQADAQNLANYTASGFTVSGATLQGDNKTVYLATSPLTASGPKSLAVQNVKDRASVPNTMDPVTQALVYADGVLRYQEYQNINGGLVTDLTSNAKFPNSPDVTSFVTIAENPNGGAGQGDNYGGRLVGYITAPVSGDYRFYMASDDNGVVYLSTDENPANKVLIASEPVWNNFRDYLGTTEANAIGQRRLGCGGDGTSEACENISGLIPLQAGNRYYFEALWKEGTGGDHMSVAWRPPGAPMPTQGIPGTYLSPLNPAAVTLAAALPGDVTISENQPLNLSINITAGTPSLVIQWYKNGNPIAGANSTTYHIDNAKMSDSGTYNATVQNSLGAVSSRSAVVTVIIDTVAPALVTALAPAGNGTQFDVVFSEPVNQADAQNLANYSLPGVALNSATLQADGKTVRIVSSSLYSDGCKVLAVNNIRDRAIPPNTLNNGQIGVVAAKGSIRYIQYNGISGVVPANLTANAKYPNASDRIVNVPSFENPEADGNNFDNYGALFQGYVHPPVSGAYRFYLASDDGSALWLSTDENPNNKVLIASEPIWSTYRSYTGTGGGGGGRACPGVTTCNISADVNLQAGCKYYVEYIYKEGGGGDYGSVTWRLPGAADPANGSAPIGSQFLSPFEVTASIPANQPADITEMAGRIVTFTADVKGSPNLTIKWLRDGVEIAGATGTSLTVGPLRYPDDNGAHFQVVAQNSLGTATSREALLTVLQDTEAPTVVAAAGSTTLDRATITFSEIIDPASADPFNFSLTGGSVAPNVVGAALSSDGKTVVLTLDPMTPLELNTSYDIGAFGIVDLSGNTLGEGHGTFHSVVEGCGGVIFEAYNAGGGNVVDNLRSYSGFPNSPDFTMIVPGMDSRLAYPTDNREAYGGRLRGLYVPPYSGRWIFYLRSDDGSELWLNPTGINPAGAQRVQMETGCCQAFEALPTQAFDLIGGHPYYMEALYKEGTGGDYVQVAARVEGSADPLVPIGARDMGQYAEPGFTGTLAVSGPTDQTVQENRNVTFSVNATSSFGLPVCYQWMRDGAPIAGANGSTYTFRTSAADNGAVFTVRASIVGNVVDSAAATLTVMVDTQGPRVIGAKGSDTFGNVFIAFDEQLDPATANDPFNYDVSGLAVTEAALGADGMSVRLTTSQQTPGASYNVTVNGVKDTSVTGNVVDAAHNTATFTAFTFNCGLLVFEAYNGIPGVAVSDLTANPNYPWNPSETRYINTFDTVAAFGSSDYRNDFGGRVHGIFVPPVSGNYIFYLRSDDASELNLNPTGIDPAGKVKIAEEPACCGPFSAHFSTPQALVAGQQYFIEGVYKEGGGGDYIQVAAKLDTDTTPPDNLKPLGASVLGIYADASGAQIRITQDLSSQTACLDPLTPTSAPVTFTIGGSATPDAAPLSAETFNSGNGGYTVQTDTAFTGSWVYDSAAGVWHADGQAEELGAPMTSRLSSPAIAVSQAGVVKLTLSHRWSFEYDGTAWDGGQVLVSVNGGPYTPVPVTAFTENGYNGSVFPDSRSVIHGQSGYISTSAGHATGARVNSSADIANLNPGDTVSVQFLYAADTNTRGGVPNWEIDSVTLTQGGRPGLPVLYQWQRNNGSGWNDIGGAVASTYTIDPLLPDNGAKFRVILSSPGTACINSGEATLTVIQKNTPPSYDLGAADSVDEDAGPRTVLGFAGDIHAHSIPRNTTLTFDRLPPSTELYGTARLANSTVHLTEPVNSIYGALAFNLPGTQTYSTFEIDWKSYIGDGAGGGADGYSVNIGTDLAGDPGYGGEEGKGNGLVITVDTFNNADLRNPDEGIQIKWAGQEVAFQNIPKDNPGNGIYLRKSAFVDAKLTVDAAGTATFTYDGQTISGPLPGYAGVVADRIMFWARTGGANDNMFIDSVTGSSWIDNFLTDAASAENGQQVSFELSNDNPSLFSTQPALSANGTLTYAAAANACGLATVTVVARDDGGTACNGDDAADAKTFTITVNCVNDCPVATAQSLNAAAGIPLPITLTGTDGDGDALTAAIASNPSHGSLAVVAGVLNYTANAGYQGPDSFTFTVSDGACTSQPATVSITVRAGSPPHCVADITPSDCGVTFPNQGKLYAIASTDGTICLALNGSGSTDPDGDSLTMSWVIDVTNTLSGPVVSTCLAAGCHTITLIVSDGTTSCQQQLEVCVVTPSEMCEQIISLVENTPVDRKNKRPLIVSLKAAKAAFESDGWGVGGQMLQVFQHKVRAQISRNNPAEAALFDAAAADVIRAIECTTNLPPHNK